MLSDLVLVQHDDIVSKMGELERLNLRGYDGGVVLLPKDAEIEDEDRIVAVNGRQTVVAAFVYIYDVVAVGHDAAVIRVDTGMVDRFQGRSGVCETVLPLHCRDSKAVIMRCRLALPTPIDATP